MVQVRVTNGKPDIAVSTLPNGDHLVVATLTDGSNVQAHAPVSFWNYMQGLTTIMVSLVNEALTKGVAK